VALAATSERRGRNTSVTTPPPGRALTVSRAADP
jgi:hypothetical protein